MEKYKTLNELNIKITKNKEVLVEEDVCTALTISLNNNGDVFTSFVGAYNPEIIKLLKKVQKTYYKGIIKKLKQQNAESVNNITKNAKINEEHKAEEPSPSPQNTKKSKKIKHNKNTSNENLNNKNSDSKNLNNEKTNNEEQN